MKLPPGSEATENGFERIEPDTFWLMYSILTDLGCSPETDDSKLIRVRFQGQTFLMEFNDIYVHVWIPVWTVAKADSPDIPKIREAINIANSKSKATVVMTSVNKDGKVGLFAHREFMLHPACPGNDQYVAHMLESFFDAKEWVRAASYRFL